MLSCLKKFTENGIQELNLFDKTIEKHQKHTNPLFYGDCDDFFILDFIFGMSTSIKNKIKIKKKTIKTFFLCGLNPTDMTYFFCRLLRFKIGEEPDHNATDVLVILKQNEDKKQ